MIPLRLSVCSMHQVIYSTEMGKVPSAQYSVLMSAEAVQDHVHSVSYTSRVVLRATSTILTNSHVL